ncbi:NusA-like transcription termination signal-binding factor [Candidatus Woesearchaeota archaeon]|nr:MAG: NusA-like transcription termination signal-binding factor [Candidatus Woesearchaeota archaeon]
MVVIDNEIIGYINLFEKHTRVTVKDCFIEDNTLVFLIPHGYIKKALGPMGKNIKRLSSMFKKNIKVIGFSDVPEKFLSNLIYPVKAKEIKLEGNDIVIVTHNVRDKGQVFGRDKTNLKRIQSLFSKYFPELKIRLE